MAQLFIFLRLLVLIAHTELRLPDCEVTKKKKNYNKYDWNGIFSLE